MSDSKVYTLQNEISIQMVAENVQRFLSEQKKLTAESLQTNGGYLVQAKAAESWKKFAGMDSAIQIQLNLVSDNTISVNIGSAKWVDKAGAAVVGALIFLPLLATSAIGAWGQKKLPEEILKFIDCYVATGVYPSVFTLDQSQGFSSANNNNVASTGGVNCPTCHSPNPENSKFCQKCGGKMGIECPNCHASVSTGKPFCPECGTSIVPVKETHTCPNCNATIDENQKFCPECGTPTPVEAPEPAPIICGNCQTELPANQKFCPECGTPAPVEAPEPEPIICENCQTELPVNQKFCPECGTPAPALAPTIQNEEEIQNVL